MSFLVGDFEEAAPEAMEIPLFIEQSLLFLNPETDDLPTESLSSRPGT